MDGQLPFPLPANLAGMGDDPAGRAWLSLLPRHLRECSERWRLAVGEPFADGAGSLTVAVTRARGDEAVLKLQFPHREAEQEAAALARWDGGGAVRLLDHDPSRSALLLERCRPGTPLHELEPDRALGVLIELLPRLWRASGTGFTPLADESRHWAETLPGAWANAGRPFERPLLDAALGLIDELAPTQGDQVLVHQDLHAGNVLRAAREPWLAIDPKPLRGEREFALAPVVRGTELGSGRSAVRHRLDRLCAELGLDRERAAGWALVQTLAWSIDPDGTVWPEMAEIARWLGEERGRGS
jgi:streptomycin 6-kinase